MINHHVIFLNFRFASWLLFFTISADARVLDILVFMVFSLMRPKSLCSYSPLYVLSDYKKCNMLITFILVFPIFYWSPRYRLS